MAVGAYFLYESMGFPGKGAAYPRWLSFIVLAIATGVLIGQLLSSRRNQVQIMDIGVLSAGMAGAKQAGIMIVSIFVIFSIAATLINLQWASVLMAVLIPVMFMRGRARILTAIIAGGFVGGFSFGVVEYLMAPIWPNAGLRDLLFG